MSHSDDTIDARVRLTISQDLLGLILSLTTAIARGELDFTSLVEHWPSAIVKKCKTEYLNARWPEGPPADFEQRLAAPRLYWQFRWLGERADWTANENLRWRFNQLRSIGKRLGLIN